MNLDPLSLDSVKIDFKKGLEFLFGRGARVTHMSGSSLYYLAVIDLPDLRVELIKDRGAILLSVGPVWFSSKWQETPCYDLSYVLIYLTGDRNFLNIYQFNRLQDAQLNALGQQLETNYAAIAALFSHDMFPRKQASLDQLVKELTVA